MKDMIKTRFNFEYENDSTVSYLVLSMNANEDILEYQLEMIDNNKCHGILDIDARYKNGEVKLYYNITSKLVLSQFLIRKKLSKMEFIDILKGIIDVLLESKEYFLYDKSFLVHEDYIYIDPSTLEVEMIYVPIRLDNDINQSFRDFLVNLIISLAKIDEKSSGNYMQRILNYLKNDIFNIYDLNSLLNEIRDNESIGNRKEDVKQVDIQDINTDVDFNSKDSYLKSDYVEKNEKENSCYKEINTSSSLTKRKGKSKKNTVRKRYKPKYILIAVLVQVLIIIALVFSLDLMRSFVGDGANVYGGITLIVAAVDILLFKNLFKKENMEEVETIKKKEERSYMKSGEPKNIKKIEDLTNISAPRPRQNQSINMLKREIYNSNEQGYVNKGYEQAAVSSNINEDEYSRINETIILDESKEGFPYLQRTNNGIIEKVSITKSNFIIGRLENYVDYLIENNVIGKVHAEILVKEKQYFIKDLSSKNGTFINGIKLRSNMEYKIDNGDNVKFANIEYMFINKL